MIRVLIDSTTGNPMTDSDGNLMTFEALDCKTAFDAPLHVNTQYHIPGYQTAVAFTLPSTAHIGDMIIVSWYNGATAATLAITGNFIGWNYIPMTSSRSELNFLWDGTNWVMFDDTKNITIGSA